MTFDDFMHSKTTLNNNLCYRALRIGVVGYSDAAKINTELKSHSGILYNLSWCLSNIQEKLKCIHGECHEFELVSGLIDIGIPGIAYHFVTSGNVNKEIFTKTVGFACAKAKDYPQFPVDEKHIIGDDWGDESSAFLAYIDGLIRIGDGKQSMEECNEFELKYPDKPIIEVTDDMVSQWI